MVIPKIGRNGDIMPKPFLGRSRSPKTIKDISHAAANPYDNTLVFDLLNGAVQDGTADHIIESHRVSKDGYGAAKALTDWFKDATSMASVAATVCKKLEKLCLNCHISGHKYISEFFTQHRVLAKKGALHCGCLQGNVFETNYRSIL